MKNNSIKFIIPLAALAVSACASSNRKQNSKTGFVNVDDVTMVCSDLQSNYAPSKGEVKMLVIPIAFTNSAKDGGSSYYTDWTTTSVNRLNNFYFGKEDSLASYYATASLGNLSVKGMIAPVYQNSTIKTSTILNDSSFEKLFDLIENAIGWVQDTLTDVNWAEYDLNQDGCIDNVHLITNYTSDEWNTPLWPHMWNTGRKGTVERPLADVYSISGIGFVDDAITAIHEQGHIFGLDDYYDYTGASSGTGVDYIGALDMQSYNCFDWNSFSKLSMGWVKPYVINGEADVTTINIKAASINGDCILIPADYSTWNGSAFDEYFLLELFAPYGNNKKDWSDYSSRLGKKSGIRLYHVDARVYGSDSRTYNPQREEYDYLIEDLEEQEINSKEDIAKWQYNVRGANNSSNWKDYPSGIDQ